MSSRRSSANAGPSLAVAAIIAILLLAATPAQAVVRYVKAGAVGLNNGTSWTNAYTSLQTALTAATSGDEIWVAASAGGYKPAGPLGDRNISFNMKNGVAIYGHFAGTENLLSERNLAIPNTTILSGDLNGNDGANFTNYGENSKHVVRANGLGSTAVLDGFTIQAGSADGILDDDGGGLLVTGGSPTIRNCLFTSNLAADGGGAVTLQSASSARFTLCGFLSNRSNSGGGVLVNSGNSPVFFRCTFQYNEALISGGAIASTGNLALETCYLSGNIATSLGGGIALLGGSASLTSCEVTDCLANSSSSVAGGGIYNDGASAALVNCTIAENGAIVGGGGGFDNDNGNPSFANCVVWGNTDSGGSGATAQIRVVSGTATVNRSIVQGGWSGAGANNSTADPRFRNPAALDFRLSDDSPAIDAGDNSAVPPDTYDFDGDGNTTEPSLLGLGGLGRFAEFISTPDTGVGPAPVVDMGAWEFRPPMALVDSTPGALWSTAGVYASLQDALAAAASTAGQVNEIWVADGMYKPDFGSYGITPGDRYTSFWLVNGIAMYGGFTGSETARAQRNPSVNVTTLSGDLSGNDNPNTSAGGLDSDPTRMDNCYHVVIGSGVDSTARLDGFTITGGHANVATDWFYGSGGGMYNTAASPTVANCTFLRNVSTESTANGGGGGMANLFSSAPLVVGCSFIRNSAVVGGGMRTRQSDTTLINCRFLGNWASGGGGGLSHVFCDGTPNWVNCLFVGNTANTYAAIIMANCSAEIRNLSVVTNASSGNGGGFATGSSNPKLRNCIFWRNTANSGATTGEVAQIRVDSGAVTVSNSDIDGLSTLTAGANINADPVFVRMPSAGPDAVWGTNDDDYGDLRTRLGSPVIDAGDGQYVPPDLADLDFDLITTSEPIPQDVAGLPRSVDDGYSANINANPLRVDMGAHEYQPGPGATSAIVHVKQGATGANNGTDWPNAYTDLQTALSAAANSGGITQQVWVAAATYKPVELTGPRIVSFHLIDNVAIYGGFAGGETLLSQRDPTTNVTTLSGEIGDQGVTTDNSFHVVSAVLSASTAVLDGLVIIAGRANGLANERSGGGLYCTGSPNVVNCRFEQNTAFVYGGGAFINGNPVIQGCTFLSNTTANTGGGIYCFSDGAPRVQLIDTTFTNNSAPSSGGAHFIRGDATLIRCRFERNRATSGGSGGVSVDPYGNPSVDFFNCTFVGNSAVTEGGALKCSSDASFRSITRLINCQLAGNTAPNGAGIAARDLNQLGGSLSLINTTLSENVASGSGGGLYCAGTVPSSPTVSNSVFWNNRDSAGTTAASQVFVANGAPTVNYSLVQSGWTGAGGLGILDLDPMFIRNPSPGPDMLWNGINDDYGDLRPYYFSPLIDAGDSAAILLDTADIDDDANTTEKTPLDLAGASRQIQDLTMPDATPVAPPVDIGAYELQPTPATTAIVRVKTGAGGLKNGVTWTDAYDDLQGALVGAANSGGVAEELWVTAGTYKPGLPHHPRTVTFKLRNDLAVYGGFSGAEGVLSQRDPIFYASILSGDLKGNDVALPAMASMGSPDPTWDENAYHVVLATGTNDTAVLDGLTITHGNSLGDTYTRGGGLYMIPGSPTILNCTFMHDVAPGGGGGGVAMYSNSSPKIRGCRFIDCRAGDGGGAASVSGGTCEIQDCDFTLCQALDAGGGLYFGAGTNYVSSCRFERNTANRGGGIVSLVGPTTLHVANCVFNGNVASSLGGGMANVGTAPTITNSIFVGNTNLGGASSRGGAIYNNVGASIVANCSFAMNASISGGGVFTVGAAPTIANCIFWGNRNSLGVMLGEQVKAEPANPGNATVNYSIVQSGWSGAGNVAVVSADPQFVRYPSPGSDGTWDGTNDDYGDLRIVSSLSPIIDSGRNAAVLPDHTDLDCDGIRNEDLPLDAAGGPRRADVPGTADCPYAPMGSCGTAPIVDMGAYEFGFQTGTRLYVNAAASGGNGDSWATAFKTLRDALAFTSSLGCGAREIWVASGTYRPDETAAQPTGSGDRNATFRLQDGDIVYGGFLPGDTLLAQRNPAVNLTILSGDLAVNDPILTDNSYHVVTGTGSTALAVLDGFMIQSGSADASGSPSAGGGFITRAGGPILRGCVISGNGGGCGAGMDSVGGRIIVTGLTTYGNTSTSGHGVGLAQSFVDLVGGWTMQDTRMDVFSSTFNGPGALTLGAGTLLKVRSIAPCTTEIALAVNGTLGSTGIFAAATGGANPIPARWEIISAPIRDFVIAGSSTRWYVAPTPTSPASLTWAGNYLDRDMTVSGQAADGLFQGGGTLTLTGKVYLDAAGGTLLHDGTLLVASVGPFQATETAAGSNELSFTIPPRFVPISGFLTSNNLGFVLAGEQTLDLAFAPATQDAPRPPPGGTDGNEPQSTQRAQRIQISGQDLQDSQDSMHPVSHVNPVQSSSSSASSSVSSFGLPQWSPSISVVQNRSSSADCRSGNPGYQRESRQGSVVSDQSAVAQASGLKPQDSSRGSGPLDNFSSSSTISLIGDSTWDNEPTIMPAGITTSTSDIRGTGNIDIDFGATLVLAGTATLNLSGMGDGVCAPTNPAGGTVNVFGKLIARDRSSVRNTNVDVKLLTFEGDTTIINNDITLLESSTGFGGEFLAEGSATIACNTITSEGDRYLDLDPDPDDDVMPNIFGNKIHVIIKQGVNIAEGELLELRTADCDYNIIGSGQSGHYQLGGSACGGYGDTWALEKLTILANAKVNLTNRAGFDFTPSDPTPEALYVKQIVMHPGAVLNAGLQRLYYQTLVDENGVALNPLNPGGGRQLPDHPLLGFSLKIIAMEDDTEFAVRLGKRTRDAADMQPSAPPFKEGSITREPFPILPDYPQNDAMLMRTMATYTTLSAASVAAKGAFARAVEAEVEITFNYMFTNGPSAQLSVYLSDKPEIDANLVEVARLVPPASGPGSIGSNQFATFSGRFPRGGLNFTRGTYVQLKLSGADARVWIDDFDPVVCTSPQCGDFDAISPYTVDEIDYLYLLSELGNRVGGSNTCADRTGGDNYVDLSDLLAWSTALHAPPLNLCDRTGTNPGGTTAPVPAPPQDQILVAGQADDEFHTRPDQLFAVNQASPTYPAGMAMEPPVLENSTGYKSGNGRLVSDGDGVMYQLHGSVGLINLSTGTVSLAPQSFTCNLPASTSVVNVGITSTGGYELTDAAFSPSSPNIVYVSPIWVKPTTNNQCAYRAAAKINIATTGCKLLQVYGKNPAVGSSVVEVPGGGCGYVHDPDASRIREIEVDTFGNLYAIAAQAAQAAASYLLVWREATGNAGEQRFSLSGQLEAPSALLVASNGKLYVSTSLDGADTTNTQVHRYTINRAGDGTVNSLTYDGAYIVNGMRMATALAQSPIDGSVWAVGYSAPAYGGTQTFDNSSPLFTTAKMAALGTSPGVVTAQDVANSDPSLPLKMPIGAVFSGCGRKGDLNSDGLVTTADVPAFVTILLGPGPTPTEKCKTDLNNDTKVNGLDLQRFVDALRGG